MNRFALALCVVVLCVGQLDAAPLDLSGWTPLTLHYFTGQPAGNWVLDSENTAVTQTINADPSFYLNNLNQTSYSMDGSWQVQTGSDDDFMGFVFGYQNSSNFYLFDWKQGSQSYVGRTAAEGMTLRKMTGSTGDALNDLTLADFWDNQVDHGGSTILATNHGNTKGWADYAMYDFHLDFNVNYAGEIHIVVKQDDTVLWDVAETDTTFSSGQFGFYNFSQQTVRYAGFEQEGRVVVPETSSLIVWSLLGALGAAIGWYRRRRTA